MSLHKLTVRYARALVLAASVTASGFVSAQDFEEVAPGPRQEATDSLVQNVASFFGATSEVAGKLVRSIVSELGMPVATIKGNEYSGAFFFGYKRGDGRLYQGGSSRPIYWAGASVGFDAGGDASKVYMLVYNAKRATDLYRTFGGVEGKLYLVAGGSIQMSAVQHESSDSQVVIVPIRAGVGWRGGVNVGSIALSPDKDKWLPF